MHMLTLLKSPGNIAQNHAWNLCLISFVFTCMQGMWRDVKTEPKQPPRLGGNRAALFAYGKNKG